MRPSRRGLRRHRVDVQKPTAGSQNAYNETADTFSTQCRRFAQVLPRDGREVFRAQQVHTDLTHVIEIDYVSGLTSAWRLKYGSRILNILEAINVEDRNRRHQLICKEEEST